MRASAQWAARGDRPHGQDREITSRDKGFLAGGRSLYLMAAIARATHNAGVATFQSNPRAVAPPTPTRAHVREILSLHGRLSATVDELEDGTDLHSAGLTSLATVGLMLALEERFDIEFPDSLLSRKTFSSIDALVAAVEALREGRPS
jgi:acyl carrier protein